MFTEHENIVWGTRCECTNDVYILQNKFHPWMSNEFAVRIPCGFCGKLVDVNADKASAYYNGKILSHFADIRGVVLDLGCGGGFLSEYALTLPGVTRVIALDNDEKCGEDLKKLGDSRLEFVAAGIDQIGGLFSRDSVDYVISRDVFMFIENTPQFFADIKKITRGGIRQMGWYKPSTQRMKNNLTPEEIHSALIETGWTGELECLDWYKCGYFIQADKPSH